MPAMMVLHLKKCNETKDIIQQLTVGYTQKKKPLFDLFIYEFLCQASLEKCISRIKICHAPNSEGPWILWHDFNQFTSL